MLPDIPVNVNPDTLHPLFHLCAVCVTALRALIYFCINFYRDIFASPSFLCSNYMIIAFGLWCLSAVSRTG